jgi:hypothetical protein
MISLKIELKIVLGITLLLGMVSFRQASATPSQSASTPTIRVPAPAIILATPYAQEPAEGICATSQGMVVEITINVDVPSPRCAIIRSDQTLTGANATSSTVQVAIGHFSSTILPSPEYSIDVPFGDYLAVGVHQLTVTPYSGP